MTARFARLATMQRLTEIRNMLVLALEPSQPTDAPVCEHPKELREDLSTLRRTGFRCKACGHEEAFDRRTGEPVNV